jgi:hypothetical protein
MAQPLTYRQLAGIHHDRASIFDRLAKDKRRDARALMQTFTNETPEANKLQAIALFDKAVHYHQLGVSATQQETDANEAADAAGEPA